MFLELNQHTGRFVRVGTLLLNIHCTNIKSYTPEKKNMEPALEDDFPFQRAVFFGLQINSRGSKFNIITKPIYRVIQSDLFIP